MVLVDLEVVRRGGLLSRYSSVPCPAADLRGPWESVSPWPLAAMGLPGLGVLVSFTPVLARRSLRGGRFRRGPCRPERFCPWTYRPHEVGLSQEPPARGMAHIVPRGVSPFPIPRQGAPMTSAEVFGRRSMGCWVAGFGVGRRTKVWGKEQWGLSVDPFPGVLRLIPPVDLVAALWLFPASRVGSSHRLGAVHRLKSRR
ncbi:hypothetical protein TheveDRAFT_1775 [Thermanaerovibrio velox DSM 12556]|uniref:Uncharacterized protein n=1 Tax=Thermanaerovibrio velox DSM 12556 TaxID=926567 RepID=H0UR56_9BACT|nr:hypothetical protein [Thermanaerovibrio velox]EHM10893.1 hypothetical protein TheveDRAFT_1775 [Thermanaerovibrio velox DSM 12556]